MERSSIALRDDAKIERKTAGVTGILELEVLGVETEEPLDDEESGIASTIGTGEETRRRTRSNLERR